MMSILGCFYEHTHMHNKGLRRKYMGHAKFKRQIGVLIVRLSPLIKNKKPGPWISTMVNFTVNERLGAYWLLRTY